MCAKVAFVKNKAMLLFLLLLILPWCNMARIVSTFPSGTQMLIELGLSEEIVGVSNYCSHENTVQRIGSALSPNLERIASLRPHWVILPQMVGNKKLVDFLKAFSLNSIELKINNLNDLYESLEILGRRFHRQKKAKNIVEGIKRQTALVRRKLFPKRILFVVGVSRALGYFKNITVASRKTFYGDVLEHMGFTVVSPKKGLYPTLSLEDFSQLEIDGVVLITTKEFPENEKLWKRFNKRIRWVRVFQGRHYFVPGPKIVQHLIDIGIRL